LAHARPTFLLCEEEEQMEVLVQTQAMEKIASELIVVSQFQDAIPSEGTTGRVDAALQGVISELVQAGDFQGKAEQMAILYPRGALPAKRVLLVGLGEQGKLTLDVVRQVAGAVARKVRELHVTRYHTVVHGALAGALAPAEAAQAIVEGTLLGSYRFTAHKTDLSGQAPQLEALTLVSDQPESAAAIEQGARTGKTIAEAVCFVRDLVNQPGNYLTPTLLAETAEDMASAMGLGCQVLEEADMAELGMGALLGVAQGSNEPAKFIILEHNADRPKLPTYVIVGKGITFDSGGISLKPAEGMEAMKDDMSGAAITLGVLRAAAALSLPIHLVGLAPATENMPDGRAYKPGDVLKSMSGQTIEVISTDAEGRLILADALEFAKRYHPKAVVDLATLTGACVIALGHVASGLMGTDPALVRTIVEASAASGEKVWELPLYEEYGEQIKSDIADVKNSGGRPGGAITAGLFLSKFTKGYSWAHLDIAATAWADATKGYLVKGATGCGLRLLVEWLRQSAA
jgi:leucyl aminopeptidase